MLVVTSAMVLAKFGKFGHVSVISNNRLPKQADEVRLDKPQYEKQKA
jgi:hypothetical protein